MAMSGAFHSSATLFSMLAVLFGHVGARHQSDSSSRYACSPFSCGELRNVSLPLRRQGDPDYCGVPSYELACSDTKATIQINNGTYYVTGINYTSSSFRVIDSSLNMHSRCPPLPRSDQFPYPYGLKRQKYSDSESVDLFVPSHEVAWASFLNCSEAVGNNSGTYRTVDCLRTSNSDVYVVTAREPFCVKDLEASCGYLALIPYGGVGGQMTPVNVSFEDIVRFMRDGFTVKFPSYDHVQTPWQLFIEDVRQIIRQIRYDQTKDRIVDVLMFDRYVLGYMFREYYGERFPYDAVATALYSVRFMLAPMSMFIFLAHKYWKTRIAIDAVEKFLRMQLMLGPTRYAYTDIIAITNHFRDKLGEGGYGSVYKGVLLPGNIHVAVKILGNSNCKGEDFISGISTIGRIHQINVVRLVGFCAEEKRRALVYEYMPNGSLDKYIFSFERSSYWDKLNEIVLGIARGINYLHQGCDMQIVHFDIKPENILLDNNFIPKVADFGLAKLSPRDNSFVPMSAMRGTIGYIGPEMISRCFGPISNKSDVYSFGMLLLEMAGGRRNSNPHAESSSQAYYPSWVYSQLSRQEVSEIGDAVDMHELEKKLCIVGLWCIQMRSHDRPTMSEVIEMLEAGIDGLEMPPRPFFCGDDHVPEADSYYMPSEMTAISEDVEDTYTSSEMTAVSEDM